METFVSIVAAYAVLFSAGYTIVSRIPGERPSGFELVSLSLAVGFGSISLLLLWSSLVRPGEVGVWNVLVPVMALAIGHGLRERSAVNVLPGAQTRFLSWSIFHRMLHVPIGPGTVLAVFVLGMEVLICAGQAMTSDLGWDGLAVWGLKAKAAYTSGGVPASYLADFSREWSHLSYPWLVPLSEMWVYTVVGGVNEFAAKALFPGFFASLLFLWYAVAKRTACGVSALPLAALIGLIPALSRSAPSGYADVAVTLYWSGSVLYMCNWLRTLSTRDLVTAAMLASFAAWTKQEGLLYWAFQASVVGLYAFAGQASRQAIRTLGLYLVVSLVVVGPWLGIQMHYKLPNVDFVAITLAETLARLDRLPIIWAMVVSEMASIGNWGLLWSVFLLSLVRSLTDRRSSVSTYLALATIMPIFCLSFGYIYSAWTPYTTHLGFSLDRLLLQQVPNVMLMIALQLPNPMSSVSRLRSIRRMLFD